MENPLLRLSKSYQKGGITRDSYRLQRAVLINSMLERDDERTATATRRQSLTPVASVKDEPVATGRLAQFTPLQLKSGAAAAVVVLLVIPAIINLLPIDNVPAEGQPSAVMTEPAAIVPDPVMVLAPVQELTRFMDDVLQDRELDFDEAETFADLWMYSSQGEKDRWLSYTQSLLRQARESADKEIIEIMETLYFELDVKLPEDLQEGA
jgi:hypothetical protein